MARKRRAPPNGQAAFSRKIAKVRRDNPGLTAKQAAGKAAGILRHKARRKRAA